MYHRDLQYKYNYKTRQTVILNARMYYVHTVCNSMYIHTVCTSMYVHIVHTYVHTYVVREYIPPVYYTYAGSIV